MKNKTIFVIALVSLLILNLGMINAEERPIYVGDIIELTIEANLYSIADIETAFEDFEIVEMIELEDVYRLKIRSFEVGDHIVNLGNSEVVIQIATLLDADKTDIIPGVLSLNKASMFIPWTLIKTISLGIGLLGLIAMIILMIKDRPSKPLSNYNSFTQQIDELDLNSEDYTNRLTSLFKAYISKGLNMSFYGLTSVEVLKKLKDYDEVNEVYEQVKQWLKICDTFNYSKDKANNESKESLKNQVLVIVKTIEKNSEVEKL